MKAICPKNENHKEFITVAHVSQDWKVDENGNWIDTVDESLEVTAKPQAENTWTCFICNAEAVVTD